MVYRLTWSTELSGPTDHGAYRLGSPALFRLPERILIAMARSL